MRAAYAYARTRARRATLLQAGQLEAIRCASGYRAALAALHGAGIEARDAAGAFRACLARFVADAERLIAAWPRPAPLLATVGLAEMENVKLGFRALRAGVRGEIWKPLWLPLGRVAMVRSESFAEAASLRAALEGLEEAPYGEAARRALDAHADDPAGFETALDLFASRRLLDAANEGGDVGRLAASVVRIRDVDAVSRAAARGVAPEDAATSSVLLRRELPQEALRALAAGELSGALRTAFRIAASTVPELLSGLRARLRAACERTFAGGPFRRACAVALLLLRLEEMREVVSIAETRLDLERS